jgi:hypothetical protein
MTALQFDIKVLAETPPEGEHLVYAVPEIIRRPEIYWKEAPLWARTSWKRWTTYTERCFEESLF